MKRGSFDYPSIFRIAGAAVLSLGAVAAWAQAPSITGLQNSYTLPGSPNYGLAPGCLFIVTGSNLANIAEASFSLFSRRPEHAGQFLAGVNLASSYTFAGTGLNDVSAFSVQVPVPSPALVWSEMKSLTSVVRS